MLRDARLFGWVWAIAIDKIFLYSRTKRAMDRLRAGVLSGQSIEEPYRALSAKPTPPNHGGVFRRGHARMENGRLRARRDPSRRLQMRTRRS